MPKQKITKELPRRFPKLEVCPRKNGEEITKFADLECGSYKRSSGL